MSRNESVMPYSGCEGLLAAQGVGEHNLSIWMCIALVGGVALSSAVAFVHLFLNILIFLQKLAVSVF